MRSHASREPSVGCFQSKVRCDASQGVSSHKLRATLAPTTRTAITANRRMIYRVIP